MRGRQSFSSQNPDAAATESSRQMAQEAAEQSLDERLNVLKELQQKNALGSELKILVIARSLSASWNVTGLEAVDHL